MRGNIMILDKLRTAKTWRVVRAAFDSKAVTALLVVMCTFILCLASGLNSSRALAAACAPTLLSHKGDPLKFPEESLQGYKSAITKGSKFIEGDVRFARTNTPVMMHDPVIDRVTTGKGKVIDMSYTEMANYKLANGEAPTTTYQFMKLAADKGVTAILDFKTTNPTPGQIAAMQSRVKSTANGKKIISAVDVATLNIWRKALPGIPSYVSTMVPIIPPAGITGVTMKYTAVTKEYVADMHKRGFKVQAWTPDTTIGWDAVALTGADAVYTNDTSGYLKWSAAKCTIK